MFVWSARGARCGGWISVDLVVRPLVDVGRGWPVDDAHGPAADGCSPPYNHEQGRAMNFFCRRGFIVGM